MNKKTTRGHFINIGTKYGEIKLQGNYNEIIPRAIYELEHFKDSVKVGIHWYYQDYKYDPITSELLGKEIYTGGEITNVISRCYSDESNWVNVEEAKSMIMNTRLDGQEKLKATYKPKRVQAEEVETLEELKDE